MFINITDLGFNHHDDDCLMPHAVPYPIFPATYVYVLCLEQSIVSYIQVVSVVRKFGLQIGIPDWCNNFFNVFWQASQTVSVLVRLLLLGMPQVMAEALYFIIGV